MKEANIDEFSLDTKVGISGSLMSGG